MNDGLSQQGVIAISAVERLGEFMVPTGLPLEDEKPLFAATADFAREFGGPITRLFVDSLPIERRSAPLVIDTMLVWLPVGTYAGPIVFHREPYPLNDLGAFDATNADRRVDQIAVILGPVGMDMLVGPLPANLPDKPLRADQPSAKERDQQLMASVDRGEMSIVRVDPRELIQYGSNTYLRHVPTHAAGFHFSMRAARGSRQPLVNAFRNIVKG